MTSGRCCLLACLLTGVVGCGGGPEHQLAASLGPVREGKAVPGTSLYREGAGPHRILLLNEAGKAHDLNAALPPEWKPDRLDTVDLVGLVGPVQEYISKGMDQAVLERTSSQITVGFWESNRVEHFVEIKLLLPATGETLTTVRVPAEAIAVRPNGNDFAVVKQKVAPWVEGRYVRPFRVIHRPAGLATAAVFTPDGRFVLASQCSASEGPDAKPRDPQLCLWDLDTGKPVWTVETPGVTRHLAILPDGKRLIADFTGQSDLFCIRELSSGALLESYPAEKWGHLAALSANGAFGVSRFLKNGYASQARLLTWDLSARKVIDECIIDRCSRVAISDSGERLLSSTGTTAPFEMAIRDRNTSSVFGGIRIEKGQDWWALFPDGKRFVIRRGFGGISVVGWSGKVEKEMAGDDWCLNANPIAVSPDGRFVTTASSASGVHTTARVVLRNLVKGEQSLEFELPDQYAASVAFSADSRSLVVGGESSLLVWRLPESMQAP